MRYPILKPVICLVLMMAPAWLYSQSVEQVDSVFTDTSSSAPAIILRGIASYYHDKFEGRQMANGKIYQKSKFTAACNRLPLNKWVRVTSLVNHRSVIVRITDRMHPRNKRLIDLSYAAAKELKMVSQGLIKVKIEVLEGYQPGG